MTVQEVKSLLDALPPGSDGLELSAVCCLCGCETFPVSVQIVEPEKDRGASPGNVRRIVLSPE